MGSFKQLNYGSGCIHAINEALVETGGFARREILGRQPLDQLDAGHSPVGRKPAAGHDSAASPTASPIAGPNQASTSRPRSATVTPCPPAQ